MRLFALVCVSAYTILSLVVGGRLIRRGLPARALPELLMGLAYFLAPGLGYPMVVGAAAVPGSALSTWLLGVGHTLIALGCAFFFFFNARVFRGQSALARTFAGACSSVLAIASFEMVHGRVAVGVEYLEMASVRSAMVTMLAVLGIMYSWTAFEGFRHHGLMRKRARVGLGDPVVANRFLLWGCAGSFQVVADCFSALSLYRGADMSSDATSILATSLVGVANSVLLVLIFMPPARYIRWLQRAPGGAFAPA
jgi:hypothetical protein